MSKSNDIKERFAALLRDSLRAEYGRIPSAAVVAREFNLRAHGTTPISQESARRWIRGVSLPEEERLRVLVNWLDLNFNSALRMGSIRPGSPLHGNGANGNGHHLPNGSAMTDHDIALLASIFDLSSQQRDAILHFIDSIKHSDGQAKRADSDGQANGQSMTREPSAQGTEARLRRS